MGSIFVEKFLLLKLKILFCRKRFLHFYPYFIAFWPYIFSCESSSLSDNVRLSVGLSDGNQRVSKFLAVANAVNSETLEKVSV